MIGQSQGILASSGSALKGLAGSHPIALGVVVGVGAYYAVNKYWLNDADQADDEVTEDEVTEAGEELDEDAATA